MIREQVPEIIVDFDCMLELLARTMTRRLWDVYVYIYLLGYVDAVVIELLGLITRRRLQDRSCVVLWNDRWLALHRSGE